jgi:L-asparaginase II
VATPDDFVPVAITSRSGVDESVHFGAVVCLGPSGAIEFAAGNPHALVYPRSATKPMQALAMVRNGLDLPAELLALVCASHDGTPLHTAAARRILGTAGLDESALQNTASMPLDAVSERELIRAGVAPASITMNCSGKHSGMLATCVHQHWSLAEYLDQHHPLQEAITHTVDDVAGERHAHVGTDGCGAPAHMMSMLGLARSFSAIASGRAGTSGDRIYEAMTTYPQMVGGDRRDVTQLMRGVPGLMAKDGADGVFAGAFPDGRAVAIKIADGGDRARPPVMLAALTALDIDVAEVGQLIESPILGHGRPVGEVRAVIR